MSNTGLYFACAFITAFHAILLVRAVGKKIDESVEAIVAKVESVHAPRPNGFGGGAFQKSRGDEKLDFKDVFGAGGDFFYGSQAAYGKLAEGFEHAGGSGEQERPQIGSAAAQSPKIGSAGKALAEEKSERHSGATADNFVNHN